MKAFGIESTCRLDWLHPLFKQMSKCIDSYGELAEWQDLPYFYNERATTSLLAGAAWRLNWVALEEFRDWKAPKAAGDNNKKCDGWGRIDLYIGGAPRNVNEMCIEVKQRFPKSNEKIDRLNEALQSAKNDAKRLKGYNSRSGLLFICPRFLPNEDIMDGCEKLISELNSLNHELLTWYFPERARLHDSKRKRTFEAIGGGRYVYPGIISVMVPDRAPKKPRDR